MKRKMVGFSLVELMVAMILGLLVTAAALQLFNTNQRVFALQQATSRIQEEGQLALRFIGQDLRRSGFTSPGSPSLPPNNNGVLFASPPNPNELTVTFHGTNDCQGSIVPGGAIGQITNRYFIQSGELRCDGNLSGGSVELLDGVQVFRVLYGVAGSGGTGDLLVNNYLPAGPGLNALLAGGGQQIAAIRFGFALRQENNLLPEGIQRTRYVLDQSYQENADKALYRDFHTTVMLRNLDWDALRDTL